MLDNIRNKEVTTRKKKYIKKITISCIIAFSVVIFTLFKLNIFSYNVANVQNNSIINTNDSANDLISNNVNDISEVSISEQNKYDGTLGSAGSLKGTTVIVSIFANDANTSWDYNNYSDNELINDTLNNLQIATRWLSQQAEKYNTNADFVYDWNTNIDLKYETTFKENLVRYDASMYEIQKDYITNNINYDKIKSKYNAENIIYFFFFNTDYSNQFNPWSLGYCSSSNYYIEFTNIFVKYDNRYITNPASYAHEIMHSFGAHDLYYKNSYINQDYVNHLSSINSNDIMYTIRNSKDITNDFTELDAYYVGLKKSAKDVEEWHLSESEHIYK